MRLWSHSWANGEPIPERFAKACLGRDGLVHPGQNLSPALRWSGVPSQTRSLALLCIDLDAAAGAAGADVADGELPAELPRSEFFHWVLIDLTPHLSTLAEGAGSRGLARHGPAGPAAPHGGRHGVNDFGARCAGAARSADQHLGYDGPLPPANDALVHHCVFALYALALERLPLEGAFGGAQVREQMAELVLASATHSGTYTLNRRLRHLPP